VPTLYSDIMRTERWLSLTFFLISTLSVAASASQLSSNSAAQPSGQAILRTSIDAMGGEAALRGIKLLQFKALVQRNALEQSERPEGPYVVQTGQMVETRDFDHRRWKQSQEGLFAWMKFSQTAIVSNDTAARIADGKAIPGAPQDLVDAEEAFDLSPERILFTALESADLHRSPDIVLHSVPQNVVQFTWNKIPATIFLNADTHLPTAVEWIRAYPYQLFWSIWGDVTTRVYYSFWWLAPGDIHYPLQLDIERNGLPDQKITTTELKINEPVAGDFFDIPADVQTAFKSRPARTADERPLAVTNAQEPAKGIVLIPGAWNTTIVKQDDGLIILEAPISSGYSAQVIREAERRYPGVPIKAAISTSDSWPHIGGVREYVARGIPVYVLDRTQPLLERFVKAPRKQFPDSLAKSPGAPKFRVVDRKTIVGSGPNRMEIYPIHGQTTERQMIVYFPEHKLLYGSDAFQKLPDGQYFYPQTISEVRDAVVREHLVVEKFYMMHMGLTSWSEVRDLHGGPIPAS